MRTFQVLNARAYVPSDRSDATGIAFEVALPGQISAKRS